MIALPFAALRFENGMPWWFWALLLVGGAFVLAWAYMEVFKRTERRLTWALLTLRAIGLLLLVLTLSKPVWTRETELIEAGRVGVILDTSASMALLDEGGKTRYARGREAVERLTAGLAKSRGAKLAVELFDVNGVSLKDGPPEKPTAGRTDLFLGLRETAKHLRGRTVAGYVIVSDGQDNSGRRSFSDLEDTATPVHVLYFPDRDTGDLDLAVEKPTVPEKVLIHNELRVDVPVTKAGQTAATARVVLKRGREVLASQKVDFDAGKAEKVVPLTYTPKESGLFEYTIAVESDAVEKNKSNNAVRFPLRVDNEPIGVLYVEGFLRNEYKFLKARLEDDPDLALISVVRLVSPDRPDARGPELFTPEAMKKVDVVILGDMEGKYLRPQEYQNLLKWLDGKNHSLLVLGGEVSFGPEGFRGTPLAEVLPVLFAASAPYQNYEDFQLKLTEKGKGHPIFALSSDRVKDAEAWEDAPPLRGMALVDRLKSTGEALAVHSKLRSESGAKELLPLIAVQPAPGGGQVMVFAADTTWLWSRLPRVLVGNDNLYSRFWSQTIRWLAGRALDDKRSLMTVSTDKTSYDVGRKVTVTLTRQPRPDLDLSKAELAVEIIKPSGESLRLEGLRSDSTNPDVLRAEFTPSTGGLYQLEATLNVAGKTASNQSAEFTVQGPELELANTATNPSTLKAIAKATGGADFEVGQAEDLVKQIAHKQRPRVGGQSQELWHSPFLFGAFILAVSAEWLLRRLYHLV